MASNSLRETLSTCDEIDNLLDGCGPGSDPHRLARINFLCAHLGASSYMQTKASRLASRASIYFSARRHASEAGGADAVMREMRYSLLKAIRDEAEHLEKSKP